MLALPSLAQMTLPALSAGQLETVRTVEARLRELPQVQIHTRHILHAGMYSRTITIPEGVGLTGAYIKIPTLLIVTGHATLYAGSDSYTVRGQEFIAASAGRKTVFYAWGKTEVTMIFPTAAKTVEEAEREFTDEHEALMSHRNPNDVLITGV